MFATGATNSADSTEAFTYSSSRRANNSRLIAEISASSRSTSSLAATLWRTSWVSASGR